MAGDARFDGLTGFAEPTRVWFNDVFAAPTPAQLGAWRATAPGLGAPLGGSVLVSAPTGSGKTLAAFLAALDRLFTAPREGGGVRVLYVSPLKALAYDVDRNLRAPLTGITRAAQRLGMQVPPVTVAMRTGDTPADERRRMARTPPDILITTPESLYLLLTSAARSILTDVETVIIDEVHAVAGTKRGAHLALSLERLERLVESGRLERLVESGRPPSPRPALQRIGLSATQRPLEEVAAFLAGGDPHSSADTGGPAWTRRPITIVDERGNKRLDVEIVVPVEDMADLGEITEAPHSGPAAAGGAVRTSIWPHVHPRILALIRAHRSTIVFANSRRLAERLCARLNELAEADEDEPIARAHHGSVAREQRVAIEEALKSGQLRCVVATSSLELGIDMGAVDLVIQVESPGSVASGLQRIGRAGHQVGAPSVGKMFPKYRGDLVECAVVAARMRSGEIEATRYPRNPLDVLAQQVVAMAAMDDWPVADLHAVVRGAAPFAELTRGQLDGVLDMLAGRYPSDEFAELRPRINWDRVEDVISGRRGAGRLAVTSGGTIPDRGLYGVFLAGAEEGTAPRRVGELDEEMVYETRPGETFTLGSSTWRIEDITRDQVLVTPAPGEPGKLPFWHGDAPGRPIEVGRAVGEFLREAAALAPAVAGVPVATAPVASRSGASAAPVTGPAGEQAGERARKVLTGFRDRYHLDELAARNLLAYIAEEADAVGTVPSDRTIVVERFRDEIGDWRLCILSPFGDRVHAPWALAIEARMRERLGMYTQTIHTDDGIVVRLPEADDAPPSDAVVIDPDDVEELVIGEIANSALFAARFRECAARALLLPRRRPGGRTPLWQQRQRAHDLLAVASRYGQFPIVLETYREVLSDVFDLPALVGLLRDIAARRVRVVEVETSAASPFASSLLFDYIAGAMYEGDAPLAERRAQALSLDRELLAELLGSGELRELIDAQALEELELELQRLAEDRKSRDMDEISDLLREIGALSTAEIAARCSDPERVPEWLDSLAAARRIVTLRVAGDERWGAAEDVARFRDGLGIPPPRGVPDVFLEPVDRPLVDLVARYARTHGPFRPEQVAGRFGLPRDAIELALDALVQEQRVVVGEFRPGGSGREWCDADVLRRIRRRSLAVLRREVEPVEPDALGRFLPGWQGVGSPLRGVDRTFEALEQLQGAPLPASVLEDDVLAARVRDYTPAWLDELAAAGDIVWVGRGPLGSRDGKVSVYLRDQAPLLAPAPTAMAAGLEAGGGPGGELHTRLEEHLAHLGASFWPQLYAAAGGGAPDDVVAALWDLVWAGVVTNDSFTALRAYVGDRGRRRTSGRVPRRRPGRVGSRSGPPAAAGRWSLVTDLLGDTASPEIQGLGGATPPPAATQREHAAPGTDASSSTRRATALAAQLLDRYGIVTRDTVAAEDIPGSFSAVYPVLKAMEESGRARRGYFIEGMGGAQFAVPGAVDRLRSVRERRPTREGAGYTDEQSWAGGPWNDDPPPDDEAALVLAATDPANPYGAALPWPEAAGRGQARRVAGAYVVLVDGRLTAYVEKGGRSIVTFTADDATLWTTAVAVAGLVTGGRLRSLRVQRIDGEDLDAQPMVAHLRAAGFVDSARGLTKRP